MVIAISPPKGRPVHVKDDA